MTEEFSAKIFSKHVTSLYFSKN